jgi:hypothetical protein
VLFYWGGGGGMWPEGREGEEKGGEKRGGVLVGLTPRVNSLMVFRRISEMIMTLFGRVVESANDRQTPKRGKEALTQRPPKTSSPP